MATPEHPPEPTGLGCIKTTRWRRTWTLHGLFAVLGAIALANACSGGHTPGAPLPQVTGNFQGAPIGIIVHGKRSWRVRKSAQYPPTEVIWSTGRTSMCEMTTFPTGPGTWPFWQCWMTKGDSITFPVAWQEPDTSPYPGETCGPSLVQVAPVGSNPGIATPAPLWVGGWADCRRLDVTPAVTFTDNVPGTGSWSFGGNYNGVYTQCNTPPEDCAYPNNEVFFEFDMGPGPPPSPSPAPTPTGGGTSWPSPYPSDVLQIYDNNNDQVVSDGLVRNSVIGLQMNLTAIQSQPQGGVGNAVPAQWSYQVDDNRILSQVLGTNYASTVPATPTPSSPTPPPMTTSIWYYRDGSYFSEPAVIEVQATVDGISQIALALYNVEEPNFGYMNATFATPGVNYNSYPGLPSFGLGQSVPNMLSVQGIISTYGATSPPDFGGWYAENQVFNSNPSPTPQTVQYPTTGPYYYDDGCWIYNVNIGYMNSPPPSAGPGQSLTYGPTYDSPNDELVDNGVPVKGLTLNWTFEDSFLYRPTAPANKAIWVAIGQRVWNWGGNVFYTPSPAPSGTWLPGTPAPYVSPGQGIVSDWLASWPNVYNPGGNCASPNPPAPPDIRSMLKRAANHIRVHLRRPKIWSKGLHRAVHHHS
jgi:hypothetical protein